MEKRLIFIFLFCVSILIGKSQTDSSKTKHSVFYSIYLIDDYQPYSFIGYEFFKNRIGFYASISVDRKKDFYSYRPYSVFQTIQTGNSYHFFRFKGSGIGVNNLIIGSYFDFKINQRLKICPLINLNTYFYKRSGIFEGEIEPGVFGNDPYDFRQTGIGLAGGISFKFQVSKRFSICQDFNLGYLIQNNSISTEYFGKASSYDRYWFAGGGFKVIVQINKL